MPEDLFAVLGEERRPWLDPGQIKETFHTRSRLVHPDQAQVLEAGAEFARLNLAQNTLREPRLRLRHLLELEYPDLALSGPAPVPAALVDLFAPIRQLVSESDALLAQKAAAPSVLARALLAPREMELRDMAEQHLATLHGLHAATESDLQRLDAEWSTRPADAGARLFDLYQRFAYLTRWTEQLRERLFQLGA
jgi:curved DNA-binding protein CbpA